MTLESVLPVLLGAGGASFVTAGVAAVQSLRKGKLENEATLLARLNDETVRQTARADAAEADTDTMRRERDQARGLAARYHTRLIQAGADVGDLPDLESFYTR